MGLSGVAFVKLNLGRVFYSDKAIGDLYYLAQIPNRVKLGTVLIEIVLTGDPLYNIFLGNTMESHAEEFIWYFCDSVIKGYRDPQVGLQESSAR